MFGLFAKYSSVGVVNTALHWFVFFFFYYGGLEPQATSNLIAFSVAVTFSFLVNARFTFRQPASLKRYLLYVPFMGALSWLIGSYADSQNISPIITIILFSLLNLVVGFIYSKYIVFRTKSI
ncbi:hypothetical protein BD65_821 [Yersinia ruckeri]|uniref:GtrA family protein n=1 Tax=Yersinia ruckeri TaxID=29486 RepID=UPI0005AC2619|nr:GtrA family protein [Yersinia ruckeri]AJI94180.1 hypothetical protein BD65_821 [Yersinia ruckeri]MCW6568669.1 GtrA family protein [Yersinia ruckeri]